MILKIVLRIVLQHQPATGLQQLFLQNDIRNLRNVRQWVRRACEYIVVLMCIRLNEAEDIAPDNAHELTYPQLFGCLINKLYTADELVYVRNIAATPRDKLIAVAARTSKQVEHLYLFKFKMIAYNIEKTLLGVIRCGPCGPVVCRRIKSPAFKSTPYDSHDAKLEKN